MDELQNNFFHKLIKYTGGIISWLLFKVHPAIIFTALLLATLFWATFLPSLKINYNIESFFSSEDPAVGFYYNHKEAFENENDFVLLGIKNKDGIFKSDFLKNVSALNKDIRKVPGVIKVFSPTNMYESVRSPVGVIAKPLIHVNNPVTYKKDKDKIYSSSTYLNSFFSTDTLSVSLLIRKEGGFSKQDNDILLNELNLAVAKYQFDEFHFAGRIHTQNYYVSRMSKQMIVFGILACILFIGSLLLIFKCIRYVLLSFGVVIISLTWIFGVISWLGIPIDLMLTLLPTLIFIISTSGSIHLIARFRHEYVSGVTKQFAIKASIRETGLTNFLNAFTTAIGFLSLIMIPVIPIQRFGLITAMGILISFFINMLVVPISMKVMYINHTTTAPVTKDERDKNKLIQLISGYPKIIMGTISFLILVAGYFTLNIRVDNKFLDDLGRGSSLKQDLIFFENNFSGIRPFEMNITPTDSNHVMDYKSIVEIEKVETYLKDEYQAGFVVSPNSYIKQINKAVHGGDETFYRIPETQSDLDKILKIAKNQKVWQRFIPVLTKDYDMARITGRLQDSGSHNIKIKNYKLAIFLKENTSHLKFRITGAAHLMDNANNHIAKGLAKGILLAILSTTIIIGLFFRSRKIAMISFFTNVIPLLLIAGFMGATGIPLKIATSLIFTITYGIAVDDTIHFLNNYRNNMKLHTDKLEVVKQTISVMWRPMFYTTVVLFSGFMILTLSEFSSIATLGLLISGSLITALLTDLLVLPLLLTLRPKRG
jgi:uncharacterized protein